MRRVLLVGILLLVLVPPAAAMRWLDEPPPFTFAGVPNPDPAEATSSSGAAVSYTAPTATDSLGASVPVTCSPASGDVFPIGTTSVDCTAANSAGEDHTHFDVTVQDTTGPVFGPLPDLTASTAAASATVTFSPSSNDVNGVSDPVGIVCTPASGSAFPIGTTPVSCTATDTRSNSTVAGFNVVVSDTGNPTISVTPPSATEATGPAGATVNYNVSASDNSGVAPSVNCGAHPSGSTFPLGTTSVTCTATDGSGNSATSAPVDVTVEDKTAPQLSLPAAIQTEADSSAGKSVSYSASAVDTVDGAVPVNCAPASGSTFPLGTTTVNCTTSDGHGNPAAGSFTVTVTDQSGPTFTGVPTDRQVEANGPSGSVVNYSLPTATDSVDGPIASTNCAPASGGTFPLGTTTVSCSAADSHGNLGSVTFHISVLDTTPPALYLPADRSVVATSAAGILSSSPEVTAYLLAARVVDIVDSHPIVFAHTLSATLPVGVTLVTFEGRDASGNDIEKVGRLTVLPPGSASVPIPPAPKPPGDVTGVKVVVGNGLARISWGAVAGAVKYIVFRSVSGTRKTSAEGHGEIVYEGTATRFTDRGLKNGTEYRYVVVSQDAAGNQSPGVAAVAVPHRDLLLSPKDGARVRKAPKLAWRRDAEADYYNAQLLLNGVKVLSVWPTGPSYKLKKSWKFNGRKYALKPGVYTWYVWPGYGARSAVDYGELLGFRSFRVVR